MTSSYLLATAAVLFLILLVALTAMVLARRLRRSRSPSHGAAARVNGLPTSARQRAHSAETLAAGAGVSPATILGSLVCTAGPLAGQRFEIPPEGLYIGRDANLAQIVVDEDHISKRHVWVGPRGGRIAVVDQGSTNGTFLNVPGSQRITEVFLNPGDIVILSEFDVARFQYQKQ